MKKLIVIHFNDIDKYPPALNFIEYFCKKERIKEIIVFSRTEYTSSNSKIVINNTKKFDKLNVFFRIMSYFWFYFKCFIFLLKNKPVEVIYYESLSFIPVYLYKLFYPRIKIICHYHEYESERDYGDSMILNRLNHFFEKKSYSEFYWISHTNNFRLDFFLNDNKNVNIHSAHILPNYPPKAWYDNAKKINLENNTVTNFVCAGALGFDDLYLKEFIIWVLEQKGKATLNLYSNNIKQEVLDYINLLNSNLIIFNGAVPYFDLPNVLNKYDIGLILYKCNTLNFVYNEPNKFFEYYSCGLDVWFPKEMIAMKPNIQIEFRPSVIEVDYTKMKPIHEMISTSVKWHQNNYDREKVFEELESFLEL